MTSTEHEGAVLPDSPRQPDKVPAPAVTRALRVLTLLEQHSPSALTLGEIARSIDAAKSSTLHVCNALERGGMIRRVPGGYQLGRRTLELGGAYLAGFNQIREFYNFCSSATLLSHEVVQIAMLEGTEVVYLARHEGHAPMRLIASIGSRFPAAPTAVGNALLSTLSDSEIADRFSGPQHFPRMTEHSVSSLSGLLAKVRAVREHGYAVDNNEVHLGIVGIAMPIPPWTTNDHGLAIGTSLAAPAATPEYIDQIVCELRTVTRDLTNPLTATPPTQ